MRNVLLAVVAFAFMSAAADARPYLFRHRVASHSYSYSKSVVSMSAGASCGMVNGRWICK